LPHARRNYALGVASGGLAGLGQAFLHPELILAGLVYALTGEPMLVAMVTIVNKAGSMLPQLWVSTHLEHRPRKMPYFVLTAAVHAACFACMIVAVWHMAREASAPALAMFFTAYFLTCLCGGAKHVMFMDMVGRMIPGHRLGSYFGSRSFLGMILGIVAGAAMIQPLLARLEIPDSYLLLLTVGAALKITDTAVFSRCREDEGPRARRKTTIVESLRRGWKWLRTDHNYRMYFWSRVAFRINYLGLAFFIPYGSEKLRSSGGQSLAALGGILVAAMYLSRLVSSLLWGKVIDRYGYRPSLIGAGLLFLLAPVLALVAPALPATFSVYLPGGSGILDLPLTVYVLALMATGAAIQGNVLGGHCFLVSCAPSKRRPSYAGFLNTATSPLTLLPFAGALLAAHTDMSIVFVAAGGGGLLSLTSALRMRQCSAAQSRK